MTRHSEEAAKPYKALTCLQFSVSDEIFNRIIHCEIVKEAWDRIEEEFHGDDKAKRMQVVNQMRLLGENVLDKRVVEKVLVSLPKKFEHKISSLEDSRDLTKIPLTELISSLQAVEQRKALRVENAIEGALVAFEISKAQVTEGGMGYAREGEGKEKKGYQNHKYENNKESYAPCSHCKKKGHSEKYCWFRPGVQCRKFVEEEEKHLFMAIKTEECSDAILSSDSWLIDSDCTNHMTPNVVVFKSLDKKYNSKVRLANGELVEVKGKEVAAIETQTSIKYIHDVLFVPNISYSLISVGHD
ncbi:hypothetical protein SLEP1_g32435 [Rubroshorea leprosula]|uniref:Retrovirus-related Pol polyprotein from transposon TNT 1-94-like beta-barrel domain-containing protein n=1 Tax=Rubroshorea leprosula TaxID=152421 RepID=A0AAV5KDA8_9ROSI|nr:hypothetical protein SLEP1_g32435 [Rubroshorea leprosula]